MNLTRLGLCVAVAGLALAGCREHKIAYQYESQGPRLASRPYADPGPDEEVVYSDAEVYDEAYDQGYEEGYRKASEAAGLIDPNTEMDSQGNVIAGEQDGQTYIEDVIPGIAAPNEDAAGGGQPDDWVDQRGWTTVEPAPIEQPEVLDPEVHVSEGEIYEPYPVYVETPVVVTRYVVIRDWAPTCGVGFGLSFWNGGWRWGIFRPGWWYPSCWSVYDPWCFPGYDFAVSCYYRDYHHHRPHGIHYGYRPPIRPHVVALPRPHLALARPLTSPYAGGLHSIPTIRPVGSVSRSFGRRDAVVRSVGSVTSARSHLLTAPKRSAPRPTLLQPRGTIRSVTPALAPQREAKSVFPGWSTAQPAPPAAKTIRPSGSPSVRIRRPVTPSASSKSTLSSPVRTPSRPVQRSFSRPEAQPNRPTIIRSAPSERSTTVPKSSTFVRPSTRSGRPTILNPPSTPSKRSTPIPSRSPATPSTFRPSTRSGRPPILNSPSTPSRRSIPTPSSRSLPTRTIERPSPSSPPSTRSRSIVAPSRPTPAAAPTREPSRPSFRSPSASGSRSAAPDGSRSRRSQRDGK